MMYYHRALILLLTSSLASAQLPPNIPQCSLNCFITAFQSDGCSNLLDFACHCAKPEVVQKVTPCVQKACSAADQSVVRSVVIQQCSAAGHPITLPPAAGVDTSTTQPQPTVPSTSSTTQPEPQPTSTAAMSLPTISSAGTPSTPQSTPGPAASSTASRAASSSLIQGSSTPGASSSSHAASPSTPLATGVGSHAEANVLGAALAAAAAVLL
ncbi:uncharacterized protein BP01DRAFT_359574 [Aspergillus saccharolyticus JOP 1030-1]|uniref:CFEM domain-containing protein n=1 Tax=Aspergillus saccharolyticus JOP 1030-1 TaxID=1450539 RepID=A0A318Z4S8_9EURO|nr:hypothetical protein BP01DRAFT_359574 [Aspergillus saccharolyticus JOP 1030-1]PYH42321.1 hypothetical protein BP01DRAFT_359574 [Aspergillus saccharolyticus JOP 1030-1]